MIAVAINTLTVIVGAIAGNILHSRIGEDYQQVIYKAIGVFTLLIGIQMGLEGISVYVAIALVIGGLAGTYMDIEGAIYSWGDKLKKKFSKKNDTTFAQGFLDASILFCVGPMTILGAFKSGAMGDHTLLLTKSMMDGFMALLLSSALGIGVAFSAIVVLIYQGALVMLASLLGNIENPVLISLISGTGGAIVIMIALSLLGICKIKTGNFFPALLVVLAFLPVA
ncbi:DUF554 domain-containing protein [Spirochaetia bacterium 38H-sp]|uniref:DUF554 domain-containing protein n=1 Tax=Rarispira pelagica TaxID=3141764 RepID=A0ABU9U9Y0_9SPIR